MDNTYFVFISYSSLDNVWAVWLRHELEHYHLPASFNGRTDVRDNLREVFRDRDELTAGPEWDKQVYEALENSENLIVICSPNAKESDAINIEVSRFIALGKQDRIFPFIVEGNRPDECFPRALNHAKLAGDVNKDGGRDAAFIKVVAGMLNVSFPSLWERYEKEKAEEERKNREQRDYLQKVRSRFLSEKVLSLISDGDAYLARMLALEALPKSLSEPDKPYVFEAERSLRSAMFIDNAILRGHSSRITSVSFSPDGSLLASASFDGSIRIWDTQNGNLIRTFYAGNLLIHAMSISPDGKTVAFSVSPQSGFCGSKDYYICVIDINNGNQCYEIRAHSAPIMSLSFSKNGSNLLYASDDGLIHLWDTINCREAKQFSGHTGCVKHVSFSPDNHNIVSTSADRTVRIWETQSGRCIKEIDTGRHPAASSIAFSPDGEHLVISWDSFLFILETRNWSLISKFDCKAGLIFDMCFSHDGMVLAAASIDKTVRLWDINSGECKQIFKGHLDKVNCVSFGSNDHLIATGSDDSTIRLWEYKSSFYKYVPRGSIELYHSVDKTKDGETQLEIHSYRIACVTDTITGDNIIECKGHTDDIVTLCYNPDESLFASCSFDKTIRIWSSKNGDCLHILKGHEEVISGITFNPTGNLIVSISWDKTIRIWDVSSGQCVQIMPILINSFAACVSFTQDGSKIVIDTQKELIVCDYLALEQLMEQTHLSTKTRQFTDEEKARFYLD